MVYDGLSMVLCWRAASAVCCIPSCTSECIGTAQEAQRACCGVAGPAMQRRLHKGWFPTPTALPSIMPAHFAKNYICLPSRSGCYKTVDRHSSAALFPPARLSPEQFSAPRKLRPARHAQYHKAELLRPCCAGTTA